MEQAVVFTGAFYGDYGLGSETTQIMRSRPARLWQMEQTSPSVRFWQMLQQWTLLLPRGLLRRKPAS